MVDSLCTAVVLLPKEKAREELPNMEEAPKSDGLGAVLLLSTGNMFVSVDVLKRLDEPVEFAVLLKVNSAGVDMSRESSPCVLPNGDGSGLERNDFKAGVLWPACRGGGFRLIQDIGNTSNCSSTEDILSLS